jgi:hypothetical protein
VQDNLDKVASRSGDERLSHTSQWCCDLWYATTLSDSSCLI